jgi:phthalate 4,5-dioxygenase oxygenase subunit
MLSKEDNEALTRVGPGTLMGSLLRQYWQPVLRSAELAERDGTPVRVRLLGEDLVAFRDTGGKVGLLPLHCPHRGASLFFGRNEEHGLRCIYHGWKFDVSGNCVDMPNEVGESSTRRLKKIGYPCSEFGSVIWAYMGPGEPPGMPELEWAHLPESHVFATKRFHECNWAQALEGDLDSSHVGLLHSNLNKDVPSFSYGWRPDGSYNTIGHHRSPRVETHETDFGLWVAARRPSKNGLFYWRATALILPFYTIIPASGDSPLHINIWQPMDDEHTLVWSIEYHGGRPLTQEERARLGSGQYAHYGPDDLLPASSEPGGRWRSKANRSNDFLIDREMQRTTSFTGLRGFWCQDRAAVESMGPIANRTTEHLGSSDVGISRFRRLVLQAARALKKEGRLPPGLHPKTHRVRAVAALVPENQSWVEAVNALSMARPGEWVPAP